MISPIVHGQIPGSTRYAYICDLSSARVRSVRTSKTIGRPCELEASEVQYDFLHRASSIGRRSVTASTTLHIDSKNLPQPRSAVHRLEEDVAGSVQMVHDLW